jgi:thioredoxin 1
MKPVIANDATFDKIIGDAQVPVLVDFGANWCPPCRAMDPVVEQLAEELKGQALVVKVDVDENPATSAKFGVRNLPTFIVFDNKKPVTKIIGAAPKMELEKRLVAAGTKKL